MNRRILIVVASAVRDFRETADDSLTSMSCSLLFGDAKLSDANESMTRLQSTMSWKRRTLPFLNFFCTTGWRRFDRSLRHVLFAFSGLLRTVIAPAVSVVPSLYRIQDLG
jgi:hypothetical protein